MSNVFNQGKTDYSVPKLFLGEPNGLMDTVHNHYPKIESLYRKLKSLDWSDQEFDFSSCVSDFQTCSKSTYDMMIRTLAWQWEADSIVAHSISPVAAPFVSNSQLWTAWCEVTKNECTHAATYSEIVRNSFDNPEDVFKDILMVQESFSRLGVIDSIMSNCTTIGHKLGLKLIDRDSQEAYDTAFMFVVALLILERLQFIASFAITFSIVESGQFIEIGTAVQKIAQDEIEIHAELDKEILRTELTTERGLETFNRLTPLIKESIDSVVNNEATWVKYLFSEGRELPGVTEELVNDWVKWNAQEIYDFFNIDSGYERLTRNPLPFMDSWLKNNNQPSPQEQTSASYLLGAVVDNVRDEALDFDL